MMKVDESRSRKSVLKSTFKFHAKLNEKNPLSHSFSLKVYQNFGAVLVITG
jgi:hypothetical protein